MATGASRHRSKTIVLASGNHACSNPRVVKEADALAAAGFQVHVLGGAYLRDLKQRDLKLVEDRPWQYHITYDLTTDASRRLWSKAQRRFGLMMWRRFALANRWQLFYGTGPLKRATALLDADLTIAHWEAALPAVLARLRRGKRVGIDMEDWFSEDLLPEARCTRPIAMLAGYENVLLNGGFHTTCTSEAMADVLVARYRCRRPVAIRNVFPLSDRDSIDCEWRDRPGMRGTGCRNTENGPRALDAPVSVHWFSQTVGPGRGLEELLSAAKSLTGDFEIHLRGESEHYANWLNSLAGERLRQRIHVHRLVGNHELLSRIAEHDVGFAGENSTPPSRDLTITNKFFQYLQGGLAVVASATQGQQEGARCAAGAVELFRPGDVEGLKRLLQRLIDDRTKLKLMRDSAWEAGTQLCWEKESALLVESVERAITSD